MLVLYKFNHTGDTKESMNFTNTYPKTKSLALYDGI